MATPRLPHGTSRFQRVAVLNRGESAVRFMRAARTWSRANDVFLSVVALYTKPDEGAMFVNMASDAYSLGDAFRDVDGQRKSSYVDIPHVMATLKRANVEAVWPGWGFLAENPDLVDACTQAGITFIGPPASAMRALGDKIAAKQLAEENDVPVSPWSRDAVSSPEVAREHAERIGFPVLLKAAAGGGGRGIRVVRASDELEEAFTSASTEAASAFGDPSLFVEAFVEKARHIEVQVIADAFGEVATLGTRDCSVQRRNQKVIEEAPAPGLAPEVVDALCGSAARLAQACGYVGVGTVEYLLLPDEKTFYFLEMNTRLQVEHTVTEDVYGVDLVGAQISIAQGARLASLDLGAPRGTAIQVRVNAEDPDDGFAPRAGRIIRFSGPDGPGVRVDSGFAQGHSISSAFDSNIAKVIAWGHTRRAALARMHTALMDLTVAMESGLSNRAFLKELIAESVFKEGPVTTRWLDGYLNDRKPRHERRYFGLALALAAVGDLEHDRRGAIANFLREATSGMPQSVAAPEAASYRYVVDDTPLQVQVACLAPSRYRVEVDGWFAELETVDTGECTLTATFEGHRRSVVYVSTATEIFVEIEGTAHAFSRTSDGRVRAALPAAVTRVHVAAGDEVAIGDRLVTLEVMKMEMPVYAPVAGRVDKVWVNAASQVAAGDVLVEISDAGDAEEEQGAEATTLLPANDAPVDAPEDILRAFLLGYDVDLETVSAVTRRLHDRSYRGDADQLMALLRISVDQDALFLSGPNDPGRNEARESSRDQLAWLARHMDPDDSKISASVLERVQRLFVDYHVDFERSAPEELQDAMLRVFQTRKLRKPRATVYMALLDALMRAPAAPVAMQEDDVREVLESFAAMAIANRGAHLSSAAWELAYQWYDMPRQAAEAKKLERMARIACIAWLDTSQSEEQHAEARERLLGLPWGSTLGGLAALPPRPQRDQLALVQVLTERRYPDATVVPVDDESAPFPYVKVEGEEGPLWATMVRSPRDVVRALEPLPEDAVVDVILGCFVENAMAIDLVAEALGRQAHQQEVRVFWGTSADGVGCRVYRHIAGALREDLLYRDLHPADPAAREIERWSNFEMARLPSPRGVILLRVEDIDENGDERLVAIVEVERFTVEQGRTIRSPRLEHVYLSAARALRSALRWEDRRTMAWNRIVVYVTPTVVLARETFRAVARRLWPPVLDLSLEQVTVVGTFSFDERTQAQPMIAEWSNPIGLGPRSSYGPFEHTPVPVLTSYDRKVMAAHRRRLFYPYEIVRWLTGARDRNGPTGTFVEYDLDGDALAPVQRPEGQHQANLMVGVINNDSALVPEGIKRVLIIGDPTNTMGSLAEPECIRVNAAIDLAEQMNVPVEWVTLSSGAKISFDSGTENLDWTAKTLQRIIDFTQKGGVINVVVDGPCVGAQSYWNAEATMMMHTKGTLVMTPRGYMVLTGKRALEYAGSVSAESNEKIGGLDIMEPNGEAQYVASDLHEAYRTLFNHYALTYVPPETGYVPRQPTEDPIDRNVALSAYTGEGGFETIGEIFNEATNPGRKKPFEIRPVMRAVLDLDTATIERWQGLEGGETAVVMHGRLGGRPVVTIGIESTPVPRRGQAPVDGPESWMSGTLFPHASRKVARAINAASGTQPVVVLANISGFDGSPESLRHRQLEWGAEIGRAVVNFDGPIVFCVISRYHGGAYVVFSQDLNPNLQAIAVEGTYASVIGGAPAAAVVFPKLVQKRVASDPRVLDARAAVQRAGRKLVGPDRERFEEVRREVEAEIQSQVAREFDQIHSIERAMKVGSLSGIVTVEGLRAELVERVERGITTHLGQEDV